jgi:hypothetical protein
MSSDRVAGAGIDVHDPHLIFGASGSTSKPADLGGFDYLTAPLARAEGASDWPVLISAIA